MDNNKRLRLTLAGMLEYHLLIQSLGCVKNDPVFILGDSTSGGDFISISRATKRNDDFKPILFDLEDIIKPILEGGKVPILELVKVSLGFDDFADPEFEFSGSMVRMTTKKGWLILSFDMSDCSFVMMSNGKTISVANQLSMFEKLKEWHFNIYQLPKEMYINKKTAN